ncbi:hypothetical protein OH768_49425 [Streptomyces sp. NBC_01622]|uniref:hypothetical protein n=1 Tax=Streptomyces sp. NBC_01622 TaxID=2975903 RepID=UPI003866B7F5|nr:hypothetical protein OH768_49425 [Streptomyces sp. NBC_01622]
MDDRLLAADEDALPRHRTLRAAATGATTCAPPTNGPCARASVFAGSFDLGAAEEVCAEPGLDRDELVDAVAGLVDKSLLVRDGDAVHARYRMLESIRQYGLDRLREHGADAEETARPGSGTGALTSSRTASDAGSAPNSRSWYGGCTRSRTRSARRWSTASPHLARCRRG